MPLLSGPTSKVLGATSLEQEINQSQETTLFQFIWGLLEKLNHLTLSFWNRILEFLHIL